MSDEEIEKVTESPHFNKFMIIFLMFFTLGSGVAYYYGYMIGKESSYDQTEFLEEIRKRDSINDAVVLENYRLLERISVRDMILDTLTNLQNGSLDSISDIIVRSIEMNDKQREELEAEALKYILELNQKE